MRQSFAHRIVRNENESPSCISPPPGFGPQSSLSPAIGPERRTFDFPDLTPSESQATNPADAGIQAIRQRGGSDLRNRTSREVKKGQFKTGKLGGCYATMTELWNAAL